MAQTSINQRIKFLVDKLSPSARAFSEAIQESPTNTFNYIGGRLVEPRADYLAKIIRHFGNISAHWLLTGDGEPFTEGEANTPAIKQNQKKNKGTVIGAIAGDAHFTTLADCEKDNASLRRENALLRSQLVDKERLIQLYERQQPK